MNQFHNSFPFRNSKVFLGKEKRILRLLTILSILMIIHSKNFGQCPTAFAGPDAAICEGATHTVTGATATNYTTLLWTTSGTGSFINSGTLTPTYTPSAIDIINGSVDLRLTASRVGCPNAVSQMHLIIDRLPMAAGTISGISPVCQGASGVVFSVPAIPFATDYIWTVPVGATILSGQTTPNILVEFSTTAASGTITVRGHNSCGDGISSSFAVTVDPLPVLAGAITGPSTVCAGQTGVQFSIPSVTYATSYFWLLPSGATITAGNNTPVITVDFAPNASPGSITARGVNSCGDGKESPSFNLSVDPLPGPAGNITGAPVVCQGQNGVTYSTTAIADATGYSWTLPPGVTIVSGANTSSITVNFSAGATSGNLTVTGTNSCGSGPTSASFAVTVDQLPAPAGIISGNNTVCQGGTGEVYSVAPIPDATGYSWTLPTGATIVAGNNTSSITVNFSGSAVSGTISVRGTNSCGSGAISPSFTVTVDPLPGDAGTITGPNTICRGKSGVVFSVTPILFATSYSWTLPAGANIVSGANSPSITVDFTLSAVSGTVTVTGSNSCGTGAVSPAFNLLLVPPPSAFAGADGNICSGNNFTVTTASASNYSSLVWTTSGSGSFAGNGTLTPTYFPGSADIANGSVTLTLTAYGLGNCDPVSDQMVLTITAQATADAGLNGSGCGTTPYLISTASALNYSSVNWTTSGSGTFINGSTLSPSYIPSSSDVSAGSVILTLNVTGTGPCSAPVTDFMTLSLTGSPVVNAGIDATVCQGNTFLLNNSSASGYNTISWSTSGSGSFSSTGILHPVYTPSAADIISGSVNLTLSGTALFPCTGSVTDAMTLIILSNPVVNAGTDISICQGTLAALSGTASNYSTVLWTTSGTGTFSAPNALVCTYNPSAADVIAGTVSLTLTANPVSPCTSAPNDILILTISPSAQADAGPPQGTCGITPVTLSGATASNYASLSWSTSGTGTFSNSTVLNPVYTPSPADLISGTVNLTLTATGIPPCAAPVSDIEILTLTIAPVLNAGPDGLICSGSTYPVTGATGSNISNIVWSTSGTGNFTGNGTLTPTYFPSAADVISGSVTLTVTANGTAACSSATVTDAMNLTISPAPIANAGPNGAVCEGNNFTISGASASNYTTINWTTSGTGTFTGNGTLTPTYFPSANDILIGSVMLTLTANPIPPCNTPATSMMMLTISSLPAAYAGADANICQGINFINPDATASNGATIHWTTTGDGAFVNPNVIRPTYIPGTNDIIFGSVTLTLQVTGNPPCPGSAMDDLQLTIDPSPTANAGPDAAICGSTFLTITGASATNYQSILWTSSGTPGTLTNPTTLTPTYTPSPADIMAGSVTLTLNAVAIPPCMVNSTDQMMIQISQPPVADAGPSAAICAGNNYTLTGSSASFYSTLLWTTSGTGTFSVPSALHPVYTPSVTDIIAGTVTLTLTATGIAPCNTNTMDVMILDINSTPAVFAGNDGTLCEGPSTIMGATATNYNTLLWTTTGDGTFINNTSLTPIYTPGPNDIASGLVTFTLTATAIPPCPGSVSDNVIYTVVEAPDAYAGPDTPICEGSTYTLINATASDFTSLAWTTSGTGFFDNPTTLNPTYTPSAADIANGAVILTLTANQTSCAPEADAMTLTIISHPVANAGSDAFICEGTNYMVFDATVQYSTSYLWASSGTGILLNPTSLTPTYIPSVTDVAIGSVVLTLTANATVPCVGTDVDQMTIFITPQSTAMAGPDANICQGQTYTIIGASATNYSALNWTTSGDGTFINGNTLSPTYTPGVNDIINGVVSLTLTTNGLNPPCNNNDIDQMLLTITHDPVVNAGPDGTICETTVSFPITGATAQYSNTVHWTSSGTGTFSNPNVLLPIYFPSAQDIANGMVSLTLTGTGPVGCNVSIQDVMILQIIEGPSVNAGSDATICETGTYYIYDASASDYSMLTWTTSGSGSFSNVGIIDPVYTPSPADIISGSVTLTLNANSLLPCTGSVSDAMVLTFDLMPVVDAGVNSSVCEGTAFTVTTASVLNSVSYSWTTNGSGVFTNPALLNTTYTPSAADIVNGSVILKLTANAQLPCAGSRADSMTLSITKQPIANAGPDATICQPAFTITNATASNFSLLNWTSSGTGFLANAGTLTPTYTPSPADILAGSVILTLTVSPNVPCGTPVADQMILTIKPVPTVYAGANATICEDQTYTISDATATDYSSVLWTSSGTGSFANGNTLNPTYTPSPADIAAGSVDLILTVQGILPCVNSVSDQLTLAIQYKPVVDAGLNGTICQGSTYSTNGAIVSNALSILWTSSGTGTFANANQLTTIYTPSALDITNGTVILTLTATSIAPCAGTVSDSRILTITPLAIVDAGPNANICADASFTVSGATASNASTINWTSSGTGTFLNGNTLTPQYTPGPADIIVGSVTLTLNATSGAPCLGNVSDALILTIDPVADIFAGADASVCENGTYTIMDAVANNFSTVNWSTSGTGTFTNGSTLNPVYTPSSDDVTAGSVILTATVTSLAPCTAVATDQVVLQVISLPTVNAGPDGTTCGSNGFNITGASASDYASLTWSTTGTGTFSNITQLNPIYFPSAADILAGTVTLQLTAHSNVPCTTDPSDTFVLTIIPSATVFAGADATVCENGTYTINDATGTNYLAVNWTTTGTGTLTGGGTLTPSYTPAAADLLAGSVVMTLHASGIPPCIDVSDQMTINILSRPVVSAGPDGTVCAGNNFSISLATVQYTSSVLWSTGGTGTFTNPALLSTTYIPSAADIAAGSVVLTLTGNALPPCAGNETDSFILTILPGATANAGLDANICQTGSYTVFGASATNYTSVSWTTSGDGGFTGGNTLTPTYTPGTADILAGSVTLTLNVHGNPLCTDGTDDMILTITKLPVANAGSDAVICGTTPYTVGDATASNYLSLNWTSSGTGVLINTGTLTPTYTPSAADIIAGSVTLTLTASGNPPCNGQDISVKTLHFQSEPVANAGPDATICEGSNYTISGASASNYSLLNWTSSGSGSFVGNGTLTPTYQPSIGDFITGSVTLTLQATGTMPCTGSATDVMLLTLIASPTANAGPDATICEGNSYTVSGASVTHQSNLYWTTTGTGILANASTLTPTYTPSPADILLGSVVLTLTAEGNPPCAVNATDQMIITIHSQPTANAGPDATICSNNSYTLNGTGATGYSAIAWTTSGSGGFTNINTLTPTYTPSAADIMAGSVTITLTAIGQNPCLVNASDAMILTIVSQPLVDAGPDATICANDTYLLSGASTSHSTGIVWTTSGDGTFSNTGLVNPVYSPGPADLLNGQAILTISVQPLPPCNQPATDNMILMINKIPTVDAGPDVTICETSYTLSGATATDYSSVLWTTTGTGILTNATTLTPTYTPSAGDITAGSVTLTLTANGILPCTVQATDNIILTIIEQATANAGPDAVICEGTSYTVAGASASNFNSLVWTHDGNGILINNGTLTPTYTPSPLDLIAGTVTLTLTAASNSPCSTPAIDQMALQITPLPVVNAGPDVSICAGSYTVSGSSATSYASLNWVTSGTGTFTNPTSVNPTYTPSAADIAGGSVTLTIIATSNFPCSGTRTDNMVLTLIAPSAVSAGSDAVICSGTSYTINTATASNYTALNWTTSGSGVFTGGTTLTPTYTPSAADIAAGSVQLTLKTFSNPPCANSSDQMILSIVTSPLANAGPDATVCGNSSFTISGATASHYALLSWSHNGTGTIINANTLNPTYTPSAGDLLTGAVTLTLTAMAVLPCNTNVSDAMVIYFNDAPTANAGSDGTICQGQDFIVTGAGATNYSSLIWTTSGSGTFINNGTLTPTYVPSSGDITSGTVTLTLTAIAVPPCSNNATDAILLIITPLPTANAGSDATICQTQTFTVTGATATYFDSYFWQTSGTGTFTNGTTLTPTYNPSPADISAGTVTLTLVVVAGVPCNTTVTDYMILNIEKTPVADAGPDATSCDPGFTVTGASASNYSLISWTSSGTGTLTNSQTISPTYFPSSADRIAGSVTLTLVVNAVLPCNGTATDFMVLNLQPLPTANAGNDDAICEGSTYTLATATATNYATLGWTTSGTGTFSNSTSLMPIYSPSALDIATGSVILTLTATSTVPCSQSVADAMTLTINKQPTAFAGIDASVCAGSYYFITDATAANNGSVYWTTNGSGTFLNGNTVSPTYQPSSADITAGSVILTLHSVAVAPCSGEQTDFLILTILPSATANAGSDATICSGSNYTLSGALATHYSSLNWTTSGNGTFSNPNILNPIYIPGFNDLLSGTVTLTLHVTGTVPCNGVITDDMVLTIDPGASANAGPDEVSCSSSFTVNSAAASNYSSLNWLTSGTGLFTNGNTISPTYTPSAADLTAGSVILTINATSVGPCTAVATDAMVLTLQPVPTANAGLNADICEGSTFTVTGASATNYGNVMWTSSGTGTFANATTLTPTYTPSTGDIASGSVTLTLTVTGNPPCNNLAADDMTLTIHENSSVNAGPDAVICAGNNFIVSAATAFNYSSLLWTSSGTGTILNFTTLTPTYIPSAGDIANGSVVLTLIGYNISPCTGNNSDAILLTINGGVTVDAGPDNSVCYPSSFTITGATASNFQSLLWTSSGTGVLLNANTLTPTYIPSISDFGAGSVALSLTGTANPPCTGSVIDIMILAISAMPGNAGTIVGPATVCQGQSGVVYSIPVIPGAFSYQWNIPAGATIVAGMNTNSITIDFGASAVSGNITVYASNGCGSGAASVPFAVQVNSLPGNPGSILGPATACIGSTGLIYSISPITGASGYTWNVPTGAMITAGAGTPSITVDFGVAAVSGNVSVYGTNACGNGPASTLAVTVLPALPTPTISANGPTTFCEGNNVILTASPAGYSYLWSTGETTQSITVTTTGTYSVTISNGSGCQSVVSNTIIVTVIPAPVANAGPDASTCGSTTYTVAGASASSYSSLLWTTSGSGSFLNANTLTPDYLPSPADVIAGNVMLTLTASPVVPCTGSTFDVMVLTFSSIAMVSAGPDDAICAGTNYSITNAVASNFSSLNWTTSGTGSFTNGNTLSPTYTPSIADITLGSVTLTLTAGNTAPCTGFVSDAMILTISQQPTVDAGSNAVICSGSTYLLFDATATNYSTLLWTTSGTGTFSGTTILNPVYTPTPADYASGSVVLTLTAGGVGNCPDVSDMMTLTFTAGPVVYAGPDTTLCPGPNNITGATAASYSSLIWTTSGTGTFINGNTLSPVYIPGAADITAGFVILSLTATGILPCTAVVSDVVVMNVSSPSTADAGPDSNICQSGPFVVTGATASNYISLNWTSSGTGTFLNAGTLTPTYIPSAADISAGSVTLTLNVLNTPCTGASDYMILTISDLPVVNAGIDAATCEANPFTVSTATATNYSSLTWSTSGSGTFINGTTLTPTYTPSVADVASGGVILTLHANATLPCTGNSSDSFVLSFRHLPLANAGADDSICSGEHFVINDATANNYASVMWTTAGTGTFVNPSSLNPTYYPSAADIAAGFVTLRLIVSNPPCSDAIDTKLLVISSPANANAGPDATICTTCTFTISGSTASNFSMLQWTTTGNGTFNNPNILHPVYTPGSADLIAGSVTLTLIATGPGVCTPTTDAMVLNIANVPGVEFSYVHPCLGIPTQFIVDTVITDVNAVAIWHWDFGDGTYSNIQDPLHTFPAVGTYPVTLQITDTNAYSSIVSHSITITPLPVSFFGFSAPTCLNNAVQFTDYSHTANGYISRWVWAYGDGSPNDTINFPDDPNVNHIYPTTGSFQVTLMITNSLGCMDASSKVVTVISNPVANFYYSDLCPDQPVQFTDGSSPNGTDISWNWNFGDPASGVNNFSSLQNPVHIYNNGGDYTVTLIIENNNGCTDTMVKVIHVNQAPFVNFSYEYTCQENVTRFTDLSVSDTTIHTWDWNFGDGSAHSMQQNPGHLYATPGTYPVTLTVRNVNQCVHDTTINVTILPKPVAEFMTDSPVCLGSPVYYTNLSTTAHGQIIKWEWEFGDGFDTTVYYPNSPNMTHVFQGSALQHLVRLTVTTTDSCTAFVEHTVTSIPGPLANFNYPDIRCEEEYIQFSDLSQRGGGTQIVSWSWNFGDPLSGINNVSIIQHPVHAFTSYGLFNVRLIVTNTNGCTDTIIKTVDISDSPDAAFSADTACLGSPTHFIDQTLATAGTIVTWNWNFGDGLPHSFLQNPTHIYAAAGVYYVTLTVTNINGCTNSVTKPVRVNGSAVAAFLYSSGSCSNAPVAFNDQSYTSQGYVVQWTWTFGDGSSQTIFFPNSQNVTHTYANGGTYNVTLTILTSNGCTGSVTNPVTVNSAPLANFSNSDTRCQDAPVTFNDLSQPNGGGMIMGWNWDFGDPTSGINNFSTLQHPLHIYKVAGTYLVTLITTNVYGCKDTVTRSVDINQVPIAEFRADSACLGTPTHFTDLSVGNSGTIISWLWNFGDGSPNVTQQNPTHTYMTAGTYNVTLTVTNSTNCISETSHPVLVTSGPNVYFTYTGACMGGLTQFTDQSSVQSGSINSWFWDFGDGSSSTLQNPTHTYALGGTYTVRHQVSSNLGCSNEILMPVVVFASPNASFDYNSSYCPAGRVVFADHSNGGGAAVVSWFWDFGDGSSSSLANPTYTYSYPDSTYIVTLIVTNSNGCRDTITDSAVFVRPGFNFTFDADPVCIGDPMYFQPVILSAGDTLHDVFWNFNDPQSGTYNTSTQYSPSHTFTNPGIYAVMLKGWNSDNCSDSIFKQVTVYPKPIPDFSFDSIPRCDGIAVFYNQTNGNQASVDTLIWDFGDGNTIIQSAPVPPTVSHHYTTFGTFNVQLTAINSNGCRNIITKQILMTCITATFTANDTVKCSNTKVTFFDNSTPSELISKWNWDFGDGSDSSYTARIPSISHIYEFPGNYHVTLTIESLSGGILISVTNEMNITVRPGVLAEFSTRSVCFGDTARFINLTDSTYFSLTGSHWNFGEPNSGLLNESHEMHTSHRYNRPGVYDVRLVMHNELGCTDTLVQQIKVFRQPRADFNVPTICSRDFTTFLDLSKPGDTTITAWAWNYGVNNILTDTSNLQSPAYAYANDGNYPVILRVTDALGCTDTAMKIQNVLRSPISAFTVTDDIDGKYGKLQMNNESINSKIYEWDFGNGEKSNEESPIVTYHDDGDYEIRLVTWAANNCSDTTILSYTFMYHNLFVPNAFSPDNINLDVRYFKPVGVNLKLYHIQVFDAWGHLLWESTRLDNKGRPMEGWDGTFNNVLMPQGVYMWKASATFKDSKEWEGSDIGKGTANTMGTVTLIR